jgi:hypothetical protein
MGTWCVRTDCYASSLAGVGEAGQSIGLVASRAYTLDRLLDISRLVAADGLEVGRVRLLTTQKYISPDVGIQIVNFSLLQSSEQTCWRLGERNLRGGEEREDKSGFELHRDWFMPWDGMAMDVGYGSRVTEI